MPIIAEGDIAGAVASVISDRDQRVCAEDIEEKLIRPRRCFSESSSKAEYLGNTVSEQSA